MIRLQVSLIPVATAANSAVLSGTTAIVFDVLRATSTIVTALASGYRKVYPVEEADTALELAHNYGFVPAGERKGDKIPGFPHGNSPLEYIDGPESYQAGTLNNNGQQASDVLVLTTTNGTKAIHWAKPAHKVYTGALLNARYVARAALQDGLDICLVCAGTAGGFSLEDTMGAGLVFMEIMRQLTGTDSGHQAADMAMDDLPIAAYELARFYHHDLLSGLTTGLHGQRLLRLGRKADLQWCTQLNRYNIAPVFTGEFITVSDSLPPAMRQ